MMNLQDVLQISPHETLLAPSHLTWAMASHIGKVRSKNEDACVVAAEVGLFLVSDGMGGHRGGDVASKIVVQDLPVMIEARLHKRRSDSPVAIGNVFRKCIIEQSRQLRLEGTSETGYVGMGATLVMVMVKNGRAYLANLGDSRIYRLRGGKLRQLSKDHSVISELLEQGRIEPQQAQGHDADGQITHYIGMDDKAMPYIRTFSLKPKDRLLLCTDGLTDMVDDVTIAGVLTRQSETQQACDELIRLANSAGGYDNITAVVLDYKNRLDRVEETVVKEK